MQHGLGAIHTLTTTLQFRAAARRPNVILHTLELEARPPEFQDSCARTGIEAAGLTLTPSRTSPAISDARRGEPGRDEQIEKVCQTITNMGAPASVPGYCFIVDGTVWRTEYSPRGRGGAKTIYDHAQVYNAPTTRMAPSPMSRWDNPTYSQAAVPVAEQEG